MARKFAPLLLLALLAVTFLTPQAGASLGNLIAPSAVCPNQTDPDAPTSTQLQAMRCMTNFARRESGLEPMATARILVRAGARKAGDILRCGEFSHEACGREFTYWMQRFGYLRGGCWGAAENIAWGTGVFAAVGSIFRAWLHSAGHRENILGPYSQIGIGLRTGSLEGTPGAHVWVQEFGSHAC